MGMVAGLIALIGGIGGGISLAVVYGVLLRSKKKELSDTKIVLRSLLVLIFALPLLTALIFWLLFQLYSSVAGH